MDEENDRKVIQFIQYSTFAVTLAFRNIKHDF